MTKLNLTFAVSDDIKVDVSIPVQIDEESMKYLGEHVIIPFHGIESAELSID